MSKEAYLVLVAVIIGVIMFAGISGSVPGALVNAF
jgi:hypothetical protein